MDCTERSVCGNTSAKRFWLLVTTAYFCTNSEHKRGRLRWRFRHRMRTAINPTENAFDGNACIIILYHIFFVVVLLPFYFSFFLLFIMFCFLLIDIYNGCICICSFSIVMFGIGHSHWFFGGFCLHLIHTVLYNLNSLSIIKLSPIFCACLFFTSVVSLRSRLPFILVRVAQ